MSNKRHRLDRPPHKRLDIDASAPAFMEFLEQTPDYKTITLKGGGKIMVLKNDKDAAP